MGKWIQRHKNTGYECDGRELAEQDAVAQEGDRASQAREDLQHSDEILQDIDEVLADVLGDTTALAFVNSYQQKGGQ